ALGTLAHWAYTQPVGQDLGADAPGSVVDRESVLHAVKGEDQPSGSLLEMRERLNGPDLIVVDNRKLAERLLPRRKHLYDWVDRLNGSGVRTGDDRREIGMNDLFV